MSIEQRTQRRYEFYWTREADASHCKKWHYNYMQEVIDEQIVRGKRGIDVGSGCGYDTYIMAKNNPSVDIVSMDLSDTVHIIKKLTNGLKNVRLIKGSILLAPLKDNIFDFAYSYGVLHHTPNPKKGISEIYRILKPNSPAFVYLYEDLAENRIKAIVAKIVPKLRCITVKMPLPIVYSLCWIFSPFVFITFSVPAKILNCFKFTQKFAEKIPFNFGKGPFSLRGDLFDTFATPLEYRFSKEEVYNMFAESGFYSIKITRLKGKAGWVISGYKKSGETR